MLHFLSQVCLSESLRQSDAGNRGSPAKWGGQVWGNLVRETDTTCVTESWSPGTGPIYNLLFNCVYLCRHLPQHLTFQNLGPCHHYLSLEKMRLCAFNSSSQKVAVVMGRPLLTFFHLPTPGWDPRTSVSLPPRPRRSRHSPPGGSLMLQLSPGREGTRGPSWWLRAVTENLSAPRSEHALLEADTRAPVSPCARWRRLPGQTHSLAPGSGGRASEMEFVGRAGSLEGPEGKPVLSAAFLL